MGSLPPFFSFDTETGRCPDGKIRTVLIQICSVNVTTPDEVIMLEGENCYQQFFEMMEETDCPMDCHAYNLNYEVSWMVPQLTSYSWVDWGSARRMKPGTFTVMADPMATYAMKICNSKGYVLKITDDMKRVGSVSMEEASKSVKREHPDWFKNIDQTKERTELYNVWYELPEGPEKDSFRHYARIDAFSQAMIARWIHEKGFDSSYTSASNGLKMALQIRYHKTDDISDQVANHWSKTRFTEKYPPLPRDMQNIIERELLGGFVYGKVGTYHGTFYHYDYSSSYPSIYHHGQLFIGQVYRITIGSENWDRVLSAPNYFRWFLCDFDFVLKEIGMPMITGKECRTVDKCMTGKWRKKMREGHCQNKLVTETYLDELMKNFEVTNLKIWECWFAKKKSGDFAPFIEKCYTEKSRPELKGTMVRHVWKLLMNGGIHGKSITKTNRKKVTYPNLVRTTEKEVSEPDLCSLIGFSAMMNARERLIRHCRLVKEAGFEIYMCDTDSMVTDCPPEEARRILGGDMFETEDGGIENLGRFEIETFEGKESFDEFRCWGLKKYLELDNGVYRKSAFAGMHDELQKTILPDWSTEPDSYYGWEQRGSKMGELGGKIVMMMTKHGGTENIWDIPNIPFKPDPKPFKKLLDDRMRRLKRIYDKMGETAVRNYLTDMMIYDEERMNEKIEEVKNYGTR